MFDEWMDGALIGICRISDFLPVALYSKQKLHEILTAHGLDFDELTEYYASSFLGLRAGEFTPVIWDDFKE